MTQHNRDDDNTASEVPSDAGSVPEIPEHSNIEGSSEK